MFDQLKKLADEKSCVIFSSEERLTVSEEYGRTSVVIPNGATAGKLCYLKGMIEVIDTVKDFISAKKDVAHIIRAMEKLNWTFTVNTAGEKEKQAADLS